MKNTHSNKTFIVLHSSTTNRELLVNINQIKRVTYDSDGNSYKVIYMDDKSWNYVAETPSKIYELIYK